MHTIFKALSLCAIALMLFCGIYSVVLGIDYLTIGYGLTPWLAFPFAAIELSCAGGALWYFCGTDRTDDLLQYVNLLERKLP